MLLRFHVHACVIECPPPILEVSDSKPCSVKSLVISVTDSKSLLFHKPSQHTTCTIYGMALAQLSPDLRIQTRLQPARGWPADTRLVGVSRHAHTGLGITSLVPARGLTRAPEALRRASTALARAAAALPRRPRRFKSRRPWYARPGSCVTW